MKRNIKGFCRRRLHRRLGFEWLEARLPLSAAVNIPTDVQGAAHSLVTVPILIDDAEGLESADIRLEFDQNALVVEDVRLGGLDYQVPILAFDARTPGKLTIGLGDAVPLGAGGGALAEIDFLISGSVIAGDSLALDLTGVSLNEGAWAR